MGNQAHANRVLVLCEFEPLLNLVSWMLRSCGVAFASEVRVQSAEGLRAIGSGEVFNAVVADFSLKDIQGIALLDTLEQSLPGMRCLFISGGSRWAEVSAEALKRGHRCIDKDELISDALPLIEDYLAVPQKVSFC